MTTLIVAQLLIIFGLSAALRYLAIDPNYGVLTAAAGLPFIRHDRRRRDLILLDIDNFKAHNTAHGHSAADDHMRDAWLAFRWSDDIWVIKRGGDEMVLSCPRGHADYVLDLVALRLAQHGLTATACVFQHYIEMPHAERRILHSKAINCKNTVLYLEEVV